MRPTWLGAIGRGLDILESNWDWESVRHRTGRVPRGILGGEEMMKIVSLAEEELMVVGWCSCLSLLLPTEVPPMAPTKPQKRNAVLVETCCVKMK